MPSEHALIASGSIVGPDALSQATSMEEHASNIAVLPIGLVVRDDRHAPVVGSYPPVRLPEDARPTRAHRFDSPEALRRAERCAATFGMDLATYLARKAAR
jgi:hypothetical protein